jgi:hypothetical protein
MPDLDVNRAATRAWLGAKAPQPLHGPDFSGRVGVRDGCVAISRRNGRAGLEGL